MKHYIRESYQEWLDSDQVTYTPSGHPRHPSRKEMCEFLLAAWAKLSKEMIKKSFVVCGLSVDAQPEDVNCMKAGNPCHAALAEAKLVWDQEPEEIGEVNMEEIPDPEQDEEEQVENLNEVIEEEEYM